MDERGYWHNRPTPEIDKLKEDLGSGDRDPSNDRPRFIISMEIGSTVEVSRGDDRMLCVFESVDKNKVTLRPIYEVGKPRPYMKTAEQVLLSNGSDPGVKAQVWDNRNGKIVLRTLPVG